MHRNIIINVLEQKTKLISDLCKDYRITNAKELILIINITRILWKVASSLSTHCHKRVLTHITQQSFYTSSKAKCTCNIYALLLLVIGETKLTLHETKLTTNRDKATRANSVEPIKTAQRTAPLSSLSEVYTVCQSASNFKVYGYTTRFFHQF